MTLISICLRLEEEEGINIANISTAQNKKASRFLSKGFSFVGIVGFETYFPPDLGVGML
ncbi:hypothetical protein GCM10011506_36340 [Marivirga lumbricoides]|uniref:N-acetyltransferase domain-containing protein n=1 Tax=Marivirga lumbricoides TaxID=1046115 RepID=A0ABQ1N263_9BACT|nr:hypothetical protein GCM10011506_36340 [Marivirga lumbricoides]